MSDGSNDRIRSIRRAAITIAVAAAFYELVARSGYFPPVLLPTLPKIMNTLIAVLLDGTMLRHAAATLYRVLAGVGLAIVVAVPLGVMMARYKAVENFFMPLASALMPIPSLAWVPVFILWFGLGNTVAVLIVFYAATFPIAPQYLVGCAFGQSDLAAGGGGHGCEWQCDVLEGDPARCVTIHHHRAAAGFPACMDRGDRRGIPRGVGFRARLDRFSTPRNSSTPI